MGLFGDIFKAVSAPVRSVVQAGGDIIQGKNVIDSVKGAVVGTAASPLATINAASGGFLSQARIPLVSDTAQSASEAVDNPFDKGNQGRLFQRGLRNTAVVGGAVFGGPALASYTGLSTGASTALAGKLSYDISQGNFGGALSSALGAAGPISTEFGEFNPKDLVSQFASQVGRLPQSPVNNFQQPAQTAVYQAKPISGGMGLLLLAGVAGLTFVLIKKGKLK